MASKKVVPIVRDEDLQDLQEFQRDLQGRADQAKADGRIFMMQQYVRLIGMVTPEITRIHARFNRETLASMRREVKDLKKSMEGEEEEGQEEA